MEDLKQWIYQKIPALKNFEFEIQEIQSGFVSLKIPLQAHLNHKGTAFGGSLYNSCILASYLLAHSELSKLGENTDSFVISNGEMKYLKPVDQDFTVKVSWPRDELSAVKKALDSKSKARWTLKAEIFVGNLLCAEFQGRFVLQK